MLDEETPDAKSQARAKSPQYGSTDVRERKKQNGRTLQRALEKKKLKKTNSVVRKIKKEHGE